MTGGANNFTPPPIPQRRKDVSWVWALAGCGGIVVLLIVGVIVAFNSNSKSGAGKLIGNIMEASSEGEQLIPVRDSLKKYRAAHGGKYPAQLKELVPTYISKEGLEYLFERKALYAPPPTDAPQDFAVVTLSTQSSEFFGQKQFYYAKILKSDEVVMDQVTRTNLETQRRGSSGASNQDDSDL